MEGHSTAILKDFNRIGTMTYGNGVADRNKRRYEKNKERYSELRKASYQKNKEAQKARSLARQKLIFARAKQYANSHI